MNTEFFDRSNQRARAICIKCKGANDTNYTHCKPCADQVEFCSYEGCATAPSEAVIKFSKSVYGKILCYSHQPAQVRERELAREVKI